MTEPASITADQLFGGAGELAQLMRAFDWSATPLGPPDNWPQALRTCVRILLTSRQPMWLGWGSELTYLYNDAYKSIIGGKHPWALGRPTAEVWREIWADIGPRIETTMRGREGTYDEALLLIMQRHGYQEETYYTFSYSPVPDDQGGVGGLFCANSDDTQRVIAERQLSLLRVLGTATAEARTVQDACTQAAQALETNGWDLPFALIYLFEPAAAGHQRAVLAGAAHIGRNHPAAPEQLAVPDDSLPDARQPLPVWPIADVLGTAEPALVTDVDRIFGDLPRGAWDRSPQKAVIVPIARSGETGRSGVLIAGLSPYRQYDETYRRFLELVAGQIAAAIGNAEAYETERRRAEALAELDRAKTNFFSNVSHEFRTPLTLLLGPLEDGLADREEALAPRQRERQELAHRNALRLLRLVNTLLDFSRIEGGRIQATFEPTDLPALTRELAATFRPAMERGGLRLVVDCPPLPEGVVTYVDREMWEKVVLNLLSNAFKFTFEGEIAVMLHVNDDHSSVELTVRDTGAGIPEDELPRLFERFHRVQGVRARTHEGTGIGLALVQELTRLHGGIVSVQSQVDRGTSFTVTIPTGKAHLPPERIGVARTQASTALGAAPFVEEAVRWLPEALQETELGTSEDEVLADLDLRQASAPPVGGGYERARVLLADDSADMRAYVSRLLSVQYDVEVVADGAAALEAARVRRPDLVVSDVMMPGLDGLGLVRAMRDDAQLCEIPIVLLSARAGEDAIVQGVEVGADDYLIKPFAARELQARVATHLHLARVRAEAAERERAARIKAEALAETNARLLAQAEEQTRIHVQLNAWLRETAEARDQARAEADAARSHLHDLFMQAPAIFCVLRGPEHVFELANPRYLETIGRKDPSEVLGKRIVDVLPEIEGQPYLGLLDQVFRTGEPFVGSEMATLLDRHHDSALEEVMYDFVYQPYRDGAGQVDGVLVVAIDVTAQVRARDALRRQAHLLDLTHDAIFVWEFGSAGRAGPITFWNPACVDLYGYSADEALGRGSHELLRTRLRGLDTVEAIDLTLERTGEWQGELVHTTRDGRELLVDSRWRLLTEIDGRRAVLETCRDITDQRRAEAELRASEARFRNLAETAHEGIWLIDLEARTVFANARLAELLGSTAEAMAGRSVPEFCFPEDIPQARERIGQNLLGNAEQFDFRFRRVDGSPVYVLVASSPVRNATGQIVGALGMLADVTDRQRLEQDKDAFLAAASHDLKNPLAAIKTGAQLVQRQLKRGDFDTVRIARLLDSVDSSASKMTGQIDALLDVTRARMGRPLELELHPTDLVALARRVAAEQQATTERHQLRVETSEPELVGTWDAVRLERVLVNLLENAIKYTPNGGTITVAIGRERQADQDWAVLSVRDPGLGIPTAELALVFEPFRRASNVGSVIPGTGVGLAGARQIAEQHGGTLTVESSEGAGSLFTLRFPLASSAG